MSTLTTDKVDKAALQTEKIGYQRLFTAYPLAPVFTGVLPVCAMGYGGQPERHIDCPI